MRVDCVIPKAHPNHEPAGGVSERESSIDDARELAKDPGPSVENQLSNVVGGTDIPLPVIQQVVSIHLREWEERRSQLPCGLDMSLDLERLKAEEELGKQKEDLDDAKLESRNKRKRKRDYKLKTSVLSYEEVISEFCAVPSQRQLPKKVTKLVMSDEPLDLSKLTP